MQAMPVGCRGDEEGKGGENMARFSMERDQTAESVNAHQKHILVTFLKRKLTNFMIRCEEVSCFFVFVFP